MPVAVPASYSKRSYLFVAFKRYCVDATSAESHTGKVVCAAEPQVRLVVNEVSFD